MSKSKISADSYSKQIHWTYKHLRAANYIHPKKLKNPVIEKVVEERMKRFELSTFSSSNFLDIVIKLSKIIFPKLFDLFFSVLQLVVVALSRFDSVMNLGRVQYLPIRKLLKLH